MCYHLKDGEKPKIAKKDLKMRKLFLPGLKSVCFHHQYRTGLQSKVKINTYFGFVSERIANGYHGYVSKEGKDRWLSVRQAAESRTVIIPKGTKYYSNEDEWVAEQIIV